MYPAHSALIKILQNPGKLQGVAMKLEYAHVVLGPLSSSKVARSAAVRLNTRLMARTQMIFTLTSDADTLRVKYLGATDFGRKGICAPGDLVN